MAQADPIRRAQIVPITDGLLYSAHQDAGETRALLWLVYFISFFCGLAQCFEGVFLPEFKEYFHLSYQQQMYVVFAKNLPFIGALAVGWLVRQKGYKNTLAMAMFLYSCGTLLLVPGLRTQNYWMVLLGFAIIGCGFTFQMVTANPLMSVLGVPEGASSRLNFGNALGAVAQIIAPATLTFIIPAAVVQAREKMVYVERLFLCLGVALAGVAIAAVFFPDVAAATIAQDKPQAPGSSRRESIWKHSRVVVGFVAIFLLLGVEASLFSFFRNYLEAPNVAGLSSHSSQRLFTVYFALFALGRLTASWIQRRIQPSVHLEIHLLASAVCLAVLIFAKGATAIVFFLALGFLVSIFFPTFYAITMENIGELAPQASGLLTIGFLGCAIIPVVQGALADSMGLRNSFWMGAGVYLLIAMYISRLRSHDKSSAETRATFVRN